MTQARSTAHACIYGSAGQSMEIRRRDETRRGN